MNQRHPDKRHVSYREDLDTFQKLNEIAARNRWDRSYTIREATARHVLAREASLHENLTMAMVARIMEEPGPDETKLARIRQELDVATRHDTDDNKKYVSYTEWADVLDDIDALAKQDRVSRGKIIRDATRLFTTLHQPPTNNASTYNDTKNAEPKPKPTSRKRKN